MFGMELMLGFFYLYFEVERRLEMGDKFFFSVFVFDGVVFEVINCCLVMLGFVWVVVVERLIG